MSDEPLNEEQTPEEAGNEVHEQVEKVGDSAELDNPAQTDSFQDDGEPDDAATDDSGEADVEFEGERPIVRELEYQAPRGKAAIEESDDADARFSSVAEAKSVIEGFLFSCNEPLTINRLSKLMSNLAPKTLRGLLLELQWDYDNRGGALQIVEIAGGYQMSTRAFVAPWMFRLHKHKRRSALSPATLETLAIIAYRQPITKGEIETIRGVESGAPLRTLQELNLIEAGGRREVVGRPQLYITTEQFLKAFGLKSVGDLPSIAELKNRFAEDTRLKAAVAKPQTEEVSSEPVAEVREADLEDVEALAEEAGEMALPGNEPDTGAESTTQGAFADEDSLDDLEGSTDVETISEEENSDLDDLDIDDEVSRPGN